MDGDGWYPILSRAARIGERMMHLKANVQPKVGAARELNAGSASCNGGQYRSPTPNAPLRKEVEREAGDPEGNLVIVERVERKRQHHFSRREYGWVGSAHRFASTQYSTAHDTQLTPCIFRFLRKHTTARLVSQSRCHCHSRIYFGKGRVTWCTNKKQKLSVRVVKNVL